MRAGSAGAFVNVTPTEILELFAEAQHLGQRRHAYRQDDGWRVFRPNLAEEPRKLPDAPPRFRGPWLVAGSPHRRPVDLHVPPLRTEVHSRCACGGYWETREGCSKGPRHVGASKAGCRLRG